MAIFSYLAVFEVVILQERSMLTLEWLTQSFCDTSINMTQLFSMNALIFRAMNFPEKSGSVSFSIPVLLYPYPIFK